MANNTSPPRERGNIGFKPSTDDDPADDQGLISGTQLDDADEGPDDTQTNTDVVEKEASRVKPGLTFSFHMNVGDAEAGDEEESET